ncbi:adenosine receptor A1 [Amia ocellicauda]|uniref:adenosine receptor A1 n=1 Tax=Amia ocellicauda TaxID=2972642 RepID=UPI003463ABF0
MDPGDAALDPLDLAYLAAEACIALASLLGNALVVWAVKLNQALRDTTFYLIVSLAVADIAVGAVAIPVAMLISLGVRMPFHACLLGCCLLCVLTQCSILSLLAIAVDRYLRVRTPVRYRSMMDTRCACLAVAVCWVLPTILGLLPMLGWNNRANLKDLDQPNGTASGSMVCSFPLVMSMEYVIYFNFFGLIFSPLVLMTGLYILVFTTIRRQLSHSQVACKANRKYYQKEMKLASSLALVLLLFAICWIPLPIINSVSFFCPHCQVPKAVLYLGILMSHANSAVNPIVYTFKIRKFRLTVLKIWRHYFVRRNSLDSSLPQSCTLHSLGAEKSDSV